MGATAKEGSLVSEFKIGPPKKAELKLQMKMKEEREKKRDPLSV
jgi:hypothetical protein